jgi:hypothetical protein
MKLRGHLHWGSHMPVLIRLMELTDGDVVELGTGMYSTPFLHYTCMLQGRKLVSYESDPSYYEIYKDYNCDFHKVIFVEDWEKLDLRREGRWGVAFIDTNPDLARKGLAKKLRANTNYVVLHDSQPKDEQWRHYASEVYPLFRRRYDYTKLMPNTTVLSNFKNINLFL